MLDFNPDEVRRAVRSIKLVGRHIPGTTCLTESLAALALLGRFGQSAFLRIGVARDEGGELTAHAWVETEGKPVIGNHSDLSRYTVLSPMETRKR
jgi:hypothetical protein